MSFQEMSCLSHFKKTQRRVNKNFRFVTFIFNSIYVSKKYLQCIILTKVMRREHFCYL